MGVSIHAEKENETEVSFMKNKRLLAILLFVLMLITATVCLSACKKNKKFVAQGEEGSYYCDVAGGGSR